MTGAATVPDGEALFDDLLGAVDDPDELSGRQLLDLRDKAEELADGLASIRASLDGREDQLEELEDRISALEDEHGLEGNSAGGIDYDDLPPAATTNSPEANSRDTSGLPSPGTTYDAAPTEHTGLPSSGSTNSVPERGRKRATLTNDAVDPRKVYVADEDDLEGIQRVNAERVIARNADLAANVSAEKVEIVENAEDADDTVVLVDPHERGASSKLRNTSATEVVPVNPEQLPD